MQRIVGWCAIFCPSKIQLMSIPGVGGYRILQAFWRSGGAVTTENYNIAAQSARLVQNCCQKNTAWLLLSDLVAWWLYTTLAT